jgi:uncharacterized integral membrane protein (TIGR00698 family)
VVSAKVKTAAMAAPPLLACAVLAYAAWYGLRQLSLQISPIALAMLIGMLAAGLVALPKDVSKEIGNLSKTILRWGIVLMGLQLDLKRIVVTAGPAVPVTLVATCGTIALFWWIGRRMGVSGALSVLVAIGTGICGAAAIVAASAPAKAKDEETGYALGVITLCGTVALFAEPALMPILGLSERAFGFWAGASIHEVAQVVAAAFAGGTIAGEVGTVVKLTRVLWLAPCLIVLSLVLRRMEGGDGKEAKVPLVPWYVLGFLATATIGSIVDVPASVRSTMSWVAGGFFVIALAGVGLGLKFGQIMAFGVRPLLLAAMASLFIAIITLGWVMLVGWI